MDKLQKFKVQQTQKLTHDTLRLTLKPCMPFQYQAGDYLLLGFEKDLLKPFSIACGPQSNGLIELHIRNRDNTDFMHQLFSVSEGDELFVAGPNPQYQLDKNICSRPQTILLVAGGTGFAPMKSLLDELLAKACNNPIEFYWGANCLEDLYLRNSLVLLAHQHNNLTYHEVLSSPAEGFLGAMGKVHEQVLKNQPDLTHARVYLCGPWDMVTQAKEDYLAAGLAENAYN